ncbi:MAG: hypothetical protein ING89_05995 [Rubrivivax sp.]|nr:hypothetical protein [Rubrivivax sp.]
MGFAQFLTHDTLGSGPTKDVWNVNFGMRWRRGTKGDWLDARQIENGSQPFATVAIPAAGRYAADVTALIQRWLGNNENRGFYLRTVGTDFPFDWTGRLSSDADQRPTLVLNTTAGTVRIVARCNANWVTSSSSAINTGTVFQTSSQAQAIVHFPLPVLSGTLMSASLELTCAVWRRVGTLQVLEADPPQFIIPDSVPNPVRGIGAAVANFAALRTHPEVLLATDFADGTYGNGFTPAAPRVFNPATGTTYAAGTVQAGTRTSLDVTLNLIQPNVDGTPATTINEMFIQYWVYLEDNFGSSVDSTKSPAFETRFGYWNPVGYWQSVGGNGGAPGDGRKTWNAAQRRWEYSGNSIRTHWGRTPADPTDYDGLIWLDYYAYHLDQTQAFPEGRLWEGVLIRRGRWYCIDLQVKMNTVFGPFDTNGNGEGNRDGELRAWVNGVLAYEATNMRWTRNPEMGVQGGWLNVFHGGQLNSPRDMGYRLDRVVLSRRYVGPPAA